MTTLSSRLDRLRTRRADPVAGYVFLKESALAKAMPGPGTQEALKYFSESAAPVSAEYTKKTFDECARVQAQLTKAFATARTPAEFDHQGSVTNNTHIRLHSDIDLLTVTENYVGLQPPLTPRIPYSGSPVADLAAMREATISGLRSAFPAAKVDDTKSRCVSISGGSLARKIDVVASNWLDTDRQRQTGDKAYRGIHVFDAKLADRVANFPFLHNKRIDERDFETCGGLRRCIRLIKSIRSDSDEDIDFSSYDITALCFNIAPAELTGEPDVLLAVHFAQFAVRVLENSALRESLLVPNGTRKIFGGAEGASLSELDRLVRETVALLEAVRGRPA